MAGRADDDTAPTPQRKADDPLARAHRNAAILRACLTHYFPDVRWPPPEGLTFFAIALAQAARWVPARTPQRIGRARYERRKLKGAATRPKLAQIWPPPAAAIEHLLGKQRAGRETLAERQFREGIAELLDRNTQHAPVRAAARPWLAPQGPLPARWALAVRDFAPIVAMVVAQHGGRVTTGPKAALTKACRDLLAIILPGEKLPALSTLSDALRKIVVSYGGQSVS